MFIYNIQVDTKQQETAISTTDCWEEKEVLV